MDPDVVSTTLPDYAITNALRSLPSISLVMPHNDWWSANNGIYYNSSASGAAWERRVSLEYIAPDGSKQWQEYCGIEINGNSSRGHGFTPKHSFRLSFKEQYGPKKLKKNLYPDTEVDEFDQLTLRGCSTDSFPVTQGPLNNGVLRWNNTRGTYLRDQWMRDMLRDMNQPTSHGRYAHLYINGLYWGVYNIAERLNDAWSEEHLGGPKEEYDVVKDFGESQAGNLSAWNQLMAMADVGFPSEVEYQALQGNQPNGTRNPNLPVLLDVGNLIDYMIAHIYGGAEDWPTHNFWASRRRGPESEGFRFYAWDQEISNESLIRTMVGTHQGGKRFELVDDRGNGAPSHLYGALRVNPSFKQRFQDRVYELLLHPDGLMTPPQNAARWQSRQQEINVAMVAESARWGDYRFTTPIKRETNWLDEMNWMATDYWPQIHPIAIARFQNAGLLPTLAPPDFSQHGGIFTPPYSLAISNTNATGSIYYTSNGSDPRATDGSPGTNATAYSGPIAFSNDEIQIFARVFDGTNWSPAAHALFLPFDADEDGLPDEWERTNGTQLGVHDAGADPDEDGHSNYQEFLAGTHPQDAGDILRVVHVEDLGAALRVRFPSVLGRTYRIEAALAITGLWTEIVTLPGTGFEIEVDIPVEPGTGRVYARVRINND
jgi:hypothetical protein